MTLAAVRLLFRDNTEATTFALFAHREQNVVNTTLAVHCSFFLIALICFEVARP